MCIKFCNSYIRNFWLVSCKSADPYYIMLRWEDIQTSTTSDHYSCIQEPIMISSLSNLLWSYSKINDTVSSTNWMKAIIDSVLHPMLHFVIIYQHYLTTWVPSFVDVRDPDNAGVPGPQVHIIATVMILRHNVICHGGCMSWGSAGAWKSSCAFADLDMVNRL